MIHLVLVETPTKLTYTGVNDMLGFQAIIQKDANYVDVRQITPISMSGGQTWQTIKADLAHLLV